jgi:hypothetical protein
VLVLALQDFTQVVSLLSLNKLHFRYFRSSSRVELRLTQFFSVFVAVFFSLLNSLNLVERLITSRYFFCVYEYVYLFCLCFSAVALSLNFRFIISTLESVYINDYEKYTKESFYLLNYLFEINFD